MKENEAIAKGYVYTGITDLGAYSNFEERRAKLKAQGYKTVIVNERVSRYSRSCPGMSYRVLYVERRYEVDRRKAELQQRLSRVEDRKAAALKAYEDALAEIAADEKAMQEELEALLNEKPFQKEYENMTRDELYQVAKAKGLKGLSDAPWRDLYTAVKNADV